MRRARNTFAPKVLPFFRTFESARGDARSVNDLIAKVAAIIPVESAVIPTISAICLAIPIITQITGIFGMNLVILVISPVLDSRTPVDNLVGRVAAIVLVIAAVIAVVATVSLVMSPVRFVVCILHSSPEELVIHLPCGVAKRAVTHQPSVRVSPQWRAFPMDQGRCSARQRWTPDDCAFCRSKRGR